MGRTNGIPFTVRAGEDIGAAIAAGWQRQRLYHRLVAQFVAGGLEREPGHIPIVVTAASTDIVVLKLNSSGAYQRHTFYGASSGNGGSKPQHCPKQQPRCVHNRILVATWQGDGGASPLHPTVATSHPPGDGFVLKLSDRVYNVYMPLIVRP